jgi:hypothetical protein
MSAASVTRALQADTFRRCPAHRACDSEQVPVATASGDGARVVGPGCFVGVGVVVGERAQDLRRQHGDRRFPERETFHERVDPLCLAVHARRANEVAVARKREPVPCEFDFGVPIFVDRGPVPEVEATIGPATLNRDGRGQAAGDELLAERASSLAVEVDADQVRRAQRNDDVSGPPAAEHDRGAVVSVGELVRVALPLARLFRGGPLDSDCEADREAVLAECATALLEQLFPRRAAEGVDSGRRRGTWRDGHAATSSSTTTVS